MIIIKSKLCRDTDLDQSSAVIMLYLCETAN